MSGTETRRIQNRIVLYALIGILLTGLVVGLATAIPLYKHVRGHIEHSAAFNARVRAMAVSQVLLGWEEIARQVTSRSVIRDELERYNAGEISREALEAFSVPKLTDALKHTEGLVGITRYAAGGEQVLAIGIAAPVDSPALPEAGSTDLLTHGPRRVGGQYYLFFSAPIVNRFGEWVGTDVVAFELAPLFAVLGRLNGFDSSANAYLGRAGESRVISAGAEGTRVLERSESGALAEGLRLAIAGEVGLVPPGAGAEVVVYADSGNGWGVAFATPEENFYAPVAGQLAFPLASIGIMLLLGTFGTLQVIKPLSDNIVRQSQQLTKSSGELRDLLEHAHGFVFRHDRNGFFTYVSEGFKSVTGYGPGELTGRFEEFLTDHPMNLVALESVRRTLDGEQGPAYLAEMRVKGGHGVVLEISMQPHYDDGRVTGVVGVARDVSERVRAEEALRCNEERLRTVINATPDIICFKDGQGRWQETNQSNLNLFRLEQSDYRGKRDSELAEVTAPELRDAFLACEESDEIAWRAGHPTRAEEVIPGPGGEQRVFDVMKVPVFAEDGARRGLVVVGRDISERKWADEELHLAASVFQDSHEAIIILDEAERVARVNTAFKAITGYTEAELSGRHLCELLDSSRSGEDICTHINEVIGRSGNWQGEVWYRRKSGEVFPAWQTLSAITDETGEVTRYAAIFSDLSEQRDSEARINYLAHYDPITDLPNRTLLNQRLSESINAASRTGSRLALLFLDLDRFKNVNDSLGHHIGDRVLRVTADRLDRSVREQDTIARPGGDEFIVLLDELHDTRDAGAVASKILEALSEPIYIEGYEVFGGGSIGISVFPEDGRDTETLIRNADAAMYRAKEQGRNTYQYYTPELTELSFERLDMETGLRRALERGDLRLHYQPQALVGDGRVVGVEALIRWQHPDKGMIRPDLFIPLAEDTGLIEPIGRWVLHTACAQAVAWQKAGLPPVRMAVNLAGYQIIYGDLVQTVRQTLEDTGLDPAMLELEITEGFVLQHAERGIQTLTELKALGVTLAIDDFGTGYSSLSYLKRLPVDRLKIDRSFVRDIPEDRDDMAIVGMIIAMARHLKLEVIAEGVEDAVQLDFLRENACDEYQGFYLGKPEPAAAIEALITPGVAESGARG